MSNPPRAKRSTTGKAATSRGPTRKPAAKTLTSRQPTKSLVPVSGGLPLKYQLTNLQNDDDDFVSRSPFAMPSDIDDMLANLDKMDSELRDEVVEMGGIREEMRQVKKLVQLELDQSAKARGNAAMKADKARRKAEAERKEQRARIGGGYKLDDPMPGEGGTGSDATDTARMGGSGGGQPPARKASLTLDDDDDAGVGSDFSLPSP
eukprot:Rmarinus@m.5609